MEKVKALTHYDPAVLADMVNEYLTKTAAEDQELISITIATAPWADDGAAGTNYTAFVLTAPLAY